MRWSRLLFVVVFFSMLHAQDIPKQTERYGLPHASEILARIGWVQSEQAIQAGQGCAGLRQGVSHAMPEGHGDGRSSDSFWQSVSIRF
jgi:hypothetical protein